MKGFKSLATRTFLPAFAAVLIVSFFSGTSFARFYCQAGYSYNPRIQLCVGNGALKGYDTGPVVKINVFKGKNHEYICPDKYAYSAKIQLCKGEGSLKGFTAQPSVKTVTAPEEVKKAPADSKNKLETGVENSKNIKKS